MQFRDNQHLFPMRLANPRWDTYYMSGAGHIYSIKSKAPPRLLAGYQAKPQYTRRYVLNGQSLPKDELYDTCRKHPQFRLETHDVTGTPTPAPQASEKPLTLPEIKRVVGLLLGVSADTITITIAA